MNFKSIILSAAIVSACGLVMANEKPAADAAKKAVKNPAEAMKKALNLTDEQAAKLKPLLDQVGTYQKEIKAKIKAGTPVDPAEVQSKVNEILAPAKDFLSEEQFKTLTGKLSKPAKAPAAKKAEKK